MKVKIKDLELGEAPRVVGIIDAPMAPARLQAFVGRGVDIFEIRADLFNKPIDSVIDYIKKIKRSMHTPLIGTVRETDFNRANRAEWLVSLAKYVDIIDIELGMPKWRKVVDGIADSAVVMVSEHDFNATPDAAGLGAIVKRAIAQGARIVKIAATAKCPADVTRLLRFTEDCETPLVAMAMGDIGKISRVIAPMFGSLFVYGYLRKPLVPGQLSALKIIGALREYCM
ncbi:MAG: type I 3-dehydroquinate dehydratase [Chitinispirillales bacterium]|jgi:3-dehydroquinate dehydratase-1|nr:type I 3-dehydroquinate dehydratase [Chitinispirillales bacterium]